VASFVAGGHAALDALAALDFDVYADPSRPAPLRFTSHLGHLLRRAYLRNCAYLGNSAYLANRSYAGNKATSEVRNS
jgi:hypothetical protein